MNTPNDVNDDQQFFKRLTKNFHQKSFYSNHINNNKFHALSVNGANQNDNEHLYVPAPKISYVSSNCNSPNKENVIGKNNGHRPDKSEHKKKLQVTVILGESLVKDVKGWIYRRKTIK